MLVTPVETDPLSVENEINDRLGSNNNTITEDWESAPIPTDSTPTPIKATNNTQPQNIDPVRPTPSAPTPVQNTTEAEANEPRKTNHTKQELTEW